MVIRDLNKLVDKYLKYEECVNNDLELIKNIMGEYKFGNRSLEDILRIGGYPEVREILALKDKKLKELSKSSSESEKSVKTAKKGKKQANEDENIVATEGESDI